MENRYNVSLVSCLIITAVYVVFSVFTAHFYPLTSFGWAAGLAKGLILLAILPAAVAFLNEFIDHVSMDATLYQMSGKAADRSDMIESFNVVFLGIVLVVAL
jgi:hypothetical protein